MKRLAFELKFVRACVCVCVCVCVGHNNSLAGIESHVHKARSKVNVSAYGRVNAVTRSVWPRSLTEDSFSSDNIVEAMGIQSWHFFERRVRVLGLCHWLLANAFSLFECISPVRNGQTPDYSIQLRYAYVYAYASRAKKLHQVDWLY